MHAASIASGVSPLLLWDCCTTPPFTGQPANADRYVLLIPDVLLLLHHTIMRLLVLMPSAAAALQRQAHNSLLLYRQYAEEYHINEELRKLLPRDEGKPIEKPAERALRERM